MGLGPGISGDYLIREQGDTGAVNEDTKAKELEAASRKLRRGRPEKIYERTTAQVLWDKKVGFVVQENDLGHGTH